MFKRALFIAALLAPLAMTPAAEASISNGAAGLLGLTSDGAPVERVQFLYGGQNYCWYDEGWRGPGWYWCGYAWRSGLGWGGGYGWHNWAWHGASRYWRGGRYRHGGWGGGGHRPGIGHPGHRPGGGAHRPGGRHRGGGRRR